MRDEHRGLGEERRFVLRSIRHGDRAQSGAGDPNATVKERCSLNDKDWFVILQMRPSGQKPISTVEDQR